MGRRRSSSRRACCRTRPLKCHQALPPQLAAVIKRCLAKQPERRYQQAGEVRAALEAVQPSVSHMEPAPAAPGLSLRRPKAAVIAIAAGVVLVLTLGIEPLRNAVGRVVSEPAIAFAERDWLLVSDFANHTGDPVFDRSLNTALSAALTQSRYVNVVPSSRIRESLRRMEKADLTRADEATAREIALREGFRLVLAPAVTSTGGTYLLSASLLDPASGATLKSETVHARTKDDVLAAVDELSIKIRSDLGEASAMIAGQTKPLVKATTGSLEALQHFSLGREAHIAQQLDKARTLYEEALRIDPTFTAARASLGIINVEFFDRAKGLELLSQALKAVDGLTDNERVSVLGFHAMVVERNLEKAADHYKTFLTLHPDVASAHNNLGRIYMQMRRFKDAIAELQETIRLDPDLFLAYFSLNSVYLYEVADLDSAIATAQRQLARNARSARAYGTARRGLRREGRPPPGGGRVAKSRGAGPGPAVCPGPLSPRPHAAPAGPVRRGAQDPSAHSRDRAEGDFGALRGRGRLAADGRRSGRAHVSTDVRRRIRASPQGQPPRRRTAARNGGRMGAPRQHGARRIHRTAGRSAHQRPAMSSARVCRCCWAGPTTPSTPSNEPSRTAIAISSGCESTRICMPLQGHPRLEDIIAQMR